jgi:hypothetical protein
MKATRIAVLAVLIGSTAAVAQSPLRAGRWEVTTQMQMPGMPVQMPEMKTTQCVTPEQLKDPANTVPKAPDGGRTANQDCKVSDYKVSGSTVTWRMACTTPQPMTSTGEMVFNGDTYTGMMKMNMPQGEMSMKLAGKRLGDCTQ